MTATNMITTIILKKSTTATTTKIAVIAVALILAGPERGVQGVSCPGARFRCRGPGRPNFGNFLRVLSDFTRKIRKFMDFGVYD